MLYFLYKIVLSQLSRILCLSSCFDRGRTFVDDTLLVLARDDSLPGGKVDSRPRERI